LASKQFGTPHEERGYCYLKDSILFIGGMTEGVIKSASFGSFDGFLLALDTSDLSYNTNPVLSIDNNAINKGIKYYPNPTSNIVNFELSNSESFVYTLTNQLGQQLEVGKLDQSSKSINLSNLQNGIYFITLRNNHNNIKIKVIKH
jgi:hypothetical protein